MSNHRRMLDALWLALQPARWSIFGFRFVPLVLLAAGVWAVVYGGFYHHIPVSETHEEQVTIVVPTQPSTPPGMTPFSPSDAFGQPGAPGQPGAFGPPEVFTPPVKFVQLIKTTKSTSEELELAVNRAVTVSGMIRGQDGEIFRVGGAAAGPAFCPS